MHTLDRTTAAVNRKLPLHQWYRVERYRDRVVLTYRGRPVRVGTEHEIAGYLETRADLRRGQ